MNPYFDNLKQFIGRLTLGQQAALSTVILGGIALLIGIAYWAGRPDYTLLFGKLEPTDASKIVESLEGQNVKYELREGGTAVYVPREEVYELRLRLAGEGLVSDGPAGYELFDQGTLGMTDFMQKLNLKRALEGELARTISSIKQVELCRVHLVLPDKSPFRDTQAQPSASVVLQLVGGGGLSPQQIEGITELVSGAVEGLDPAAVTILDTRGNLLSNPEATNADGGAGSAQLKQQRAVENHLTEKGQSMLDQVLGAGNAIVRVSANLDFSKTVAEKESIDPESQTVISEEQLEETGGAQGSANSSVKNYELSRTRERSEKQVGDVEFLTVSVILNQKQPPAPVAGSEEDEKTPAPEPAPYTTEEVQNIQGIVMNAVGFNPDRGDRIAVHQTRFDTSVDQQLAEEIREQRQNENLQLYLRYGLMVLALGLAVWLIRSASKHVTGAPKPEEKPAKAAALAAAPAAAAALPRAPATPLPLAATAERPAPQVDEEEDEDVDVNDVFASKLSREARRRLKAKHLMFEEIKQQVLTNPSDAVEVLRSWITEERKN